MRGSPTSRPAAPERARGRRGDAGSPKRRWNFFSSSRVHVRPRRNSRVAPTASSCASPSRRCTRSHHSRCARRMPAAKSQKSPAETMWIVPRISVACTTVRRSSARVSASRSKPASEDQSRSRRSARTGSGSGQPLERTRDRQLRALEQQLPREHGPVQLGLRQHASGLYEGQSTRSLWTVKRRLGIVLLALVVSGVASASAASMTRLPGFRSPSGNIGCFFVPGKPATLICTIARADYTLSVSGRGAQLLRSGSTGPGSTLQPGQRAASPARAEPSTTRARSAPATRTCRTGSSGLTRCSTAGRSSQVEPLQPPRPWVVPV